MACARGPDVPRAPRRRRIRVGLMVAGAALLAALGTTSPRAIAVPNSSGSSNGVRSRAAAPSPIIGAGSTYAANAIQQWQVAGQAQGLNINYSPQGSPVGLNNYAQNSIDFAGTEAEFSSLFAGTAQTVSRGYQYIPDVAGGIAVMYNVQDKAGRQVTYLHLSRHTIAKIFMGVISNWSDPAISADNKGLQLPNQPINVVYRSGESGTTALFYDFVANLEPGLYGSWVARNRLPTNTRIISLDNATGFSPRNQGESGSDLLAQTIKSGQGLWSIGYDEMSYAITYKVPTAWVDNGGGQWTQPYALNMTEALKSALLRPDLSQDLRNVYTSSNPQAYPISAYSYLVTQCLPNRGRATCTGPYRDAGKTETLRRWLRYIACDGQVPMAQIGYAPLPTNLSQEVANSIARMTGAAPEILTPANCANPRFHGSLGPGATNPVSDPLAGVTSLAGGGGGAGGLNGLGVPGAAGSGSSGAAGANGAANGAGAGSSAGAEASRAGVGRKGGVRSVGGGSGVWRNSDPAAYTTGAHGMSSWAWLLLVCALVIPVVGGAIWQRKRHGISRTTPSQGRLRRRVQSLRAQPRARRS